MRNISATEANRHFSTLLREVAEGESVVVTSRGRAVATVIPAVSETPQRDAARERLLARLKQQQVIGVREWTRDELYDDPA